MTRADAARRAPARRLAAAAFGRRIRIELRALAPFALAALVAGCAVAPTTPRHPLTAAACTPRVLERLYFGQSDDRGPLPAGAWDAFVERVVTPRFPSGFTVQDANGQWRGRDGVVGREQTRVVEIVHDDDAAPAQLIDEIVAAYRRDFRQEAVLVVRQPVAACL
jgi:poly(3-hydroxybutyrate) depolymerase